MKTTSIIVADLLDGNPGTKIVNKEKSLFMKLLNILLFFVPGFLKNYATTINSTIYLPQAAIDKIINENPEILPTVFHEMMHVKDANSDGNLLFQIKYLMPQIFTALAPVLFLLFGFKGLLLGLFFILPLPALYRKKYEERAYLVSLYVKKRLIDNGFYEELDKSLDFYLEAFTGPSYYFMWTLPGFANDMKNKLNLIKDGKHPFEHSYFSEIDEIFSK